MVRVFKLVLMLATYIIVATTTNAIAHRQGETYVYLDVTDISLSGRFELSSADLQRLFKLDSDADGLVAESEFEDRKIEIYQFFQNRIAFLVNEKTISISVNSHTFLDAGFSTFVQINFDTGISESLPDRIDVIHKSYFEDDQDQPRTLLLFSSNSKIGLTENEATHSLIFEPGIDKQSLNLVSPPNSEIFWTFLEHGIVHILIGLDHVAFLIVLLLPSVLKAVNGRWEKVDSFKSALWNLLTIVTLFTIAHSVTLSLAALDLVDFPERLIEVLIAASIAVVALANILVASSTIRWVSVFALGLLHGLGFANVLAPLGVASTTIVVSLVGFNLGVEIGQALIVILCFPILYLLRGTTIYVPLILRGGSIVILLIALLWFFERAFGFNFAVRNLFGV